MESQQSSRSRASGHPERVAAFWERVRHRAGWLLEWLWTFDVHGDRDLPDGPLIIISNHVSYVDPLLVGWALPRAGAFMAKQELFRIPAIHWFITNAGAFPVSRGTGDAGAMATAEQILDGGWPLIIYPEGTRNDSARWGATRLRAGAARIALKHRVPIVPVATVNCQHILPKGAWWPRRVKAEARIGKPLMPEDYLPPADWPMDEQIRHVNQLMFRALAELLPESMLASPEQMRAAGFDVPQGLPAESPAP